MSRTGIVAWVGLGCAAGAIAAALVLKASLSSVEARLAGLERAPAKIPEKPPAPAQPAELTELRERLFALHEQVSAARSQAANLAMALARTQQVLARDPAFAGLEYRMLGRFTSGKETSALLPEGGDEKRDSDWLWAEFAPHAKGVDKLQAYGRSTGSHEGYSVRICARGILGVPGRYGHMGGYEQFFLVSEVLAIGAAAAAACKKG